MTTSNPAVTRVCKLVTGGTPGTSGSDSTEVADCLGKPFIPVRLIWQVTTALAGATPSVMTLTWEPDAGSATGDKQIVVFSLPAQAVDTVGYVDIMDSEGSSTTIGAGGPTSAYGIGGSKSYAGEVNSAFICGPGGALKLATDGGLDSGAAEWWLEYQELSMANSAQDEALVRIVATTIGE